MLSARPTVTRTSRHDPHGAALESVAAEFALLAQRRARTARQLDLLGRQLNAAQVSLDAVQARMAMLACRMDGIDPALRPPPHVPVPQAAPAGQSQPPPVGRQAYAPPPPYYQPARAETPPAQPYKASRLIAAPRPQRQLARRRPFLPE
jgi:hypothetical protein